MHCKMKPACPTHFPACLLCNCLVGYGFTRLSVCVPGLSCSNVTDSTVEDWGLPVFTESVQGRLVMFTTGLFAFKYGPLVLMACLLVESWYLTRSGWEVFQAKEVALQDKMASVTNKP